jgi:hypothetical protein
MPEIVKYEDLSDYTYDISPFKLPGVVNVGWIDVRSQYPRGSVPELILQKIKDAAAGSEAFRPLVDPVREFPKCDICGDLKLPCKGGVFFKNSELWVPSGDIVFASPISILHYIEVHNYLPPAEFIAAVEALDLNAPFNADSLYREKLVESGWFHRART